MQAVCLLAIHIHNGVVIVFPLKDPTVNIAYITETHLQHLLANALASVSHRTIHHHVAFWGYPLHPSALEMIIIDQSCPFDVTDEILPETGYRAGTIQSAIYMHHQGVRWKHRNGISVERISI